MAKKIALVKTPATQLDPAELAYHQSLIKQKQETAKAHEAAALADAQSDAAIQSWSKFLADRYGLEVGDSIGESGAITRKPTP